MLAVHNKIIFLVPFIGEVLVKGGVRNFCLGGPSCNTNIFIKATPHTHIHTFFYYIHTLFYLMSYIYTHTQKKKKNLVFSIKIIFDGNLS